MHAILIGLSVFIVVLANIAYVRAITDWTVSEYIYPVYIGLVNIAMIFLTQRKAGV